MAKATRAAIHSQASRGTRRKIRTKLKPPALAGGWCFNIELLVPTRQLFRTLILTFVLLSVSKVNWRLRPADVLSVHKTPVKNRFMLLPEAGVAPPSEFVHFFRYQHPDSFPQLLFKESGVKTHLCEHSFDVVQHSSDNLMWDEKIKKCIGLLIYKKC
jgi:hypothetical protein